MLCTPAAITYRCAGFKFLLPERAGPFPEYPRYSYSVKSFPAPNGDDEKEGKTDRDAPSTNPFAKEAAANCKSEKCAGLSVKFIDFNADGNADYILS